MVWFTQFEQKRGIYLKLIAKIYAIFLICHRFIILLKHIIIEHFISYSLWSFYQLTQSMNCLHIHMIIMFQNKLFY